MKLSSKLLLLKLLIIFSFVCGYLFNNLTQENTKPKKLKKEVAKKVTKKADKKVTNVFSAIRGELVAETKSSTVNNDDDIVVNRIDCKLNDPVIIEIKQRMFNRSVLLCTKPKYNTSYYVDMIRDVHIRSPMTLKVLNHMVLVLRQRLGYRVDHFEFIAEVTHNLIIWEHVKDLAAGNSSP